jgi:DNA-directed RNA polymerase sigma subunit (sigma70/sigma32)
MLEECVLDQAQREQVEQRLWDREDTGIRELLYALSYNPRRVIELRYGFADGHRYSVKEVADVFAKSTNWVKAMESAAIFQLYQFCAGTM